MMEKTVSDVSGIYSERVLGARDTCANCFRLIRAERLQPARGYHTPDHLFEAATERVKRNTQIEYVPTEQVSDSKTTFCECAVEDFRPSGRVWESDDITTGRLQSELGPNLLTTLGRKDIDIHHPTFARHSIAAFKTGYGVDKALAIGVRSANLVETAKR